jgi:predicted outer membrane repeat protein
MGGANPRVEECVFEDNDAGGSGGAIRVQGGAVEITGCTLVGNAAAAGAGIHCQPGATATVERSIIAFSTRGGAASCSDPAALEFSCSDLYGNAGGDWVGPIAGQLGVSGNLSEDPLFCSADDGDLQIDAGSPCAPVSGRDCGLIGALGIGCSVTSVPEPKRTDLAVTSHPNPFNPRTTIELVLGKEACTSVRLYSIDGRLVRTLAEARLPSGRHRIAWDGRDDGGSAAASGLYLCRVVAGDRTAITKLSLLR